ncbi:MAG: PAS domain-containing protein [Caulobacterales bacterium]|jgi:PAS domain S-box-containing protein|nr:PAS domain-containing protein [Caulobacterales bacterium]
MINALPPEVLVQIVDATPLRVFWKDRESRFLGCNQLFADDAGVPNLAELIGKSDYFFCEPQQASAFRDDDADVMLSGVPRLGIVGKFTHANGEARWLEVSKIPLRDAEGLVWGVIGIYQDITARIQAEEARCISCLASQAAA